eukprot:scaffold1237_cov67-Phaeocystis_antarctica.AAC.2
MSMGKGRRRAHMSRFVRIHVGVGQRCRALDVESPAILQTTSTRNVPAALDNETLRYGFNLSRQLTILATLSRRWNACGFNASETTHVALSPSRDVQPDQLSPASGRDIHDPPRSLGVEHDAPGHLRLDGHVAVDAERRTAFIVAGAHVVGELVGARHQHDPAHHAIAECRNEVTRAERVPRAGLQRRRGRWRRQRRLKLHHKGRRSQLWTGCQREALSKAGRRPLSSIPAVPVRPARGVWRAAAQRGAVGAAEAPANFAWIRAAGAGDLRGDCWRWGRWGQRGRRVRRRGR